MSKRERLDEIAIALREVPELPGTLEGWRGALHRDPGYAHECLLEHCRAVGEQVRALETVLSSVEYPLLSTREHATILAALRAYQNIMAGGRPARDALLDIATDNGQEVPLGLEEIDALAERLNTAAEE